jgi:hypothetical protein
MTNYARFDPAGGGRLREDSARLEYADSTSKASETVYTPTLSEH